MPSRWIKNFSSLLKGKRKSRIVSFPASSRAKLMNPCTAAKSGFVLTGAVSPRPIDIACAVAFQ